MLWDKSKELRGLHLKQSPTRCVSEYQIWLSAKKFWDITLLIEIMSKEKCVDSKKFFPNEFMKKNDYLQWRLVSKTWELSVKPDSLKPKL